VNGPNSRGRAIDARTQSRMLVIFGMPISTQDEPSSYNHIWQEAVR
jgi:hypothetical protein